MMESRLARFWYRFKNQFQRTKPRSWEPPRFLRGSKEELRRVTTWMCHLHSDYFQLYRDNLFKVRYWGRCGDNPGYAEILWYPCGSPPPRRPERDIKALNRLLTVALIHNEFVFTRWSKTYDHGTNENSFCETVMPPSVWTRIFDRNARFHEFPNEIQIKVAPPSAHERAEALLALSEWLDGKISEREKRELLQLPDDVKI